MVYKKTMFSKLDYLNIFMSVLNFFHANTEPNKFQDENKPSSVFDGHGGDILLPYLWAVLATFHLSPSRSEK